LVLVGLAVLGGILSYLQYLHTRRRTQPEPVSHSRAA
jgi:hypothetical protein